MTISYTLKFLYAIQPYLFQSRAKHYMFDGVLDRPQGCSIRKSTDLNCTNEMCLLGALPWVYVMLALSMVAAILFLGQSPGAPILTGCGRVCHVSDLLPVV
jgi:hypothetical protein